MCPRSIPKAPDRRLTTSTSISNAVISCSLVGASGSGKTTLLSLLLREEEATSGEIRVAGNDLRRITNRQVPQYRRSLGFVFQDYKLLNNKTVWENVAFALR